MFGFFKKLNEKDTKIKIGTIKYLEKIIKIISTDKDKGDPKLYADRWYEYGGQIRFCTEDRSILKKTKLKTLEIEEVIGDTYWLRADQNEYELLYRSRNRFKTFIDNNLKPTYDYLKKGDSDKSYDYVLIQYEGTIATIMNTIEECIELNGDVVKEVEDMAVELLNKFIEAINENKINLINLEKKELEAVNKHFVERLEFEKEIVDKYIS